MRLNLTADLLLAALHRSGAPQTSGDLYELARIEALDAGVPRPQVMSWSAKGMGSMLKKLRDQGDIERVGQAHTDGERILSGEISYQPAGGIFDRHRPLPDPVEDARHPLDTMTRPRQLAVFDLTGDLLAVCHRALQDELADTLAKAQRLQRLLEDLNRDARTRLAAHGLDAD